MITLVPCSCKSTTETGTTLKKEVFREMALKLSSVDTMLKKKTAAVPGFEMIGSKDDSTGYLTDRPDSHTTGNVILGQFVFSGSEYVRINYIGLPCNQYDWIKLMEESEPDDQYGEWFYTCGKTSGTYTFRNVPPGRDEVRLYYDWRGGGYQVQGRIKITVE